MVTIPAKVKARLTDGIKKFQPIVKNAQLKDINESDTVTIISDMLSVISGMRSIQKSLLNMLLKRLFATSRLSSMVLLSF